MKIALLAAIAALFAVPADDASASHKKLCDTVVRHFTASCDKGGGSGLKARELRFNLRTGKGYAIGAGEGCKGKGGGNCGVGKGDGGGNGTGNEGKGKGPKWK